MNIRLGNFMSKGVPVLVSLSLVLAACGQSTSRGSKTLSDDGKGNAASTPVPGNSDEEQGVVITFAGDEWLRSTYEPLMEEFHRQYPNITVKFAPFPEITADTMTEPINFQKMLATTGDTGITWIGGSATAGHYLLDLQPLMEGDPGFDSADFWTGSLEACQDGEGRSLGIPTTIQITGIYYDEEAFAEASLPLPRPGWTWDDFRKAMVTTARSGGRYGYAEQSHNTFLIPQIDGEITRSDGEIDIKKIQQSVQWYLDLVDEGVIFPPLYAEDADTWNKIWQNWQEMFTSPQRPVMWVGQLSDSLPGADLVFDEKDPFKNSAINVDGFAPFPVSAENPNEKTSIASTQCLAVSKGSLNPRAAWTWVNFLSQQWTGRSQNQMWELMQIPARKSTIEANNYWDVLPEKAIPALQFALEHAWYQPGSYGLETNVVINAIVQAAAGIGEFETLLAQAKENMPVIPTPIPDDQPVVVATVQPAIPPDVEVVSYFANLVGEEEATLTRLADRYNQAHPGQVIQISIQIDAQGDWFPALVEQFDCFIWYPLNPATQDYARLFPLEPFLEGEGKDFINDFNPELLKSFTQEGQLYGLPAAIDFEMMAYNKDLLANKGLEIPNNDWTMDDFTSLLELIGVGDGDERTYGYLSDMWDESLFYSRDVRWADLQANPPLPMINSQEMISFLEWLVELKNSGGIYIQNPENYAESDQIFRNGQIAFFRTYASQPEGWYFINGEPPFEIGVAPYPLFDDPTGGSFRGSARAFMISRKAQNPQACWDWIAFLSEQPAIQPGVPARRSVIESPGWEAVVGQENAKAMRAALQNLRPQQVDIKFDPIGYPLSTWRNDAIHKALSGEDIPTALNEAQQKSVAYLACMKGVEFDQTDEDTISAYVEKIRSCARQADPDGSMWQPGQ